MEIDALNALARKWNVTTLHPAEPQGQMSNILHRANQAFTQLVPKYAGLREPAVFLHHDAAATVGYDKATDALILPESFPQSHSEGEIRAITVRLLCERAAAKGDISRVWQDYAESSASLRTPDARAR